MSFLLGTLLHSIRETAYKLLVRFKDVLYKLVIFLLTSTVILWLSVFLYGTFYYTYMPSVSHVKPVHFQFRTCPPDDGPCSFPSANVTLVKKGRDQLLMRGQQYKVYLDLEMPESPKNKELGMFMVKIDFLNRKGDIIHSSSRSAILHYKSPLMHTLNTLFYSPLLLMGSLEEKQLINVELFDYYEEDPRTPSVTAAVEIQNYNIEIYSSSLRIYAHFTGLRYLMFHWPLLSAIVGIGTILFFLSVVALLSWYRYMITNEKTQVVVKVTIEDNGKRMEERRKQAKEFLIRERERQSTMLETDRQSRSRSRSRSPAPKSVERLRLLDKLPSDAVKPDVTQKEQLTYKEKSLLETEALNIPKIEELKDDPKAMSAEVEDDPTVPELRKRILEHTT